MQSAKSFVPGFCISLVLLFMAGCSSGSSGVSVPSAGLSGPPNGQPVTPGPVQTPKPPPSTAGSLSINLQLATFRSVKIGVKTFLLELHQDSLPVLSRRFERTGSGLQVLSVDDIVPGTYLLRLTYLSAGGTTLGTFERTVAITAGTTTIVDDPNYTNIDAPKRKEKKTNPPAPLGRQAEGSFCSVFCYQ